MGSATPLRHRATLLVNLAAMAVPRAVMAVGTDSKAVLAAVAPWLGGVLGEQVNAHPPFWEGAAAVLLAAVVLAATRGQLSHIDDAETELNDLTDQASAVTVASER